MSLVFQTIEDYDHICSYNFLPLVKAKSLMCNMRDGNVNPRMTKSNVIYVVVFSIALNNVVLLNL
jgi:hypothetical protein